MKRKKIEEGAHVFITKPGVVVAVWPNCIEVMFRYQAGNQEFLTLAKNQVRLIKSKKAVTKNERP